MRLTERYIGRALFSHIAMVLSVLLALYFFTTLMAEIGVVGRGSYSIADAVEYSFMLLPRQAYELFPLVALVGAILGIGSLASSNELTVLRAAGVSVNRMMLIVMKSGVLIILLVVAMGETVAPYIEKSAQQDRLMKLEINISANTSDGLWARDGRDFINISALYPDGIASQLVRYRFDGIRMIGIDSAPNGRYKDGVWVVGPVVKTNFDESSVTTHKVESETWRSTLTPDVVGIAAMAPENLALWELLDLVAYLQDNGLASERYETAMWMRIFSPLATGGMILLALPFIFGPLRAVTIGQRVMIGSLVGIFFYLLNGVFSRLGILYGIEPALSAGAPLLLVFSLWLYLMRRVH